eukprot:TRINITY_DN5782_c0_g1_i1.p1 TRINITY_DN5782_c0_g1~~TRINITY_DN5782_c0_g1_i1.p1  ORF type:complete len:259 (-),score=28.12 TRINITY_DN5782_c0_g1_i1:23-799(-)
MAKSKYEYVKTYERDDFLLPECYVVVRIDGRSFHKFTTDHSFEKPNDTRGISIMNKCATEIMKSFTDIEVAYGESDEYSFVISKRSNLFQRRSSKICTTIVSFFSSNYVFHWSQFFPETPLQYPPTFDARCVCYPSRKSILDYLSWRQADCHINNLYNTCFWNLVLKENISNEEAQNILKGTLSAAKNEILFTRLGINYTKEPAMFRKGSILFRDKVDQKVIDPRNGKEVIRKVSVVLTVHEDFIGLPFWNAHPHLLV